ncbi:MAG TPA: hypothetical protein VE988_29180 [Gemmataceae bacterium]|nr:hypothetical protein [Gemmataceae bacterium]
MTDGMCWYRVFGYKTDPPDFRPLHVICHLVKDSHGWYQAKFPMLSGDIELDRWLPEEDGIRSELNTWAAWVEVNGGPELGWLMQRVVATAQLFSWPVEPSHSDAVFFSGMLARFLSAATDGVYQIDHQGFFKADGTLLLRETP